MRWSSDAIILSILNSGEDGKIATVFSNENGKWKGFVNSQNIDIGDICNCSWSSRLPDQLGRFKLEKTFSSFQSALGNSLEMLSVQSVCELLNSCIYERDSHPYLYEATVKLFLNFSIQKYALWEVCLLQEIGYGLDLTKCSLSGGKNVYYISPKSGKSCVKECGDLYKDKLFVIPNFWLCSDKVALNEIHDSIKITGYFINKLITEKRKSSFFYRELILKNMLEFIDKQDFSVDKTLMSYG